jgi:hypothetical protein
MNIVLLLWGIEKTPTSYFRMRGSHHSLSHWSPKQTTPLICPVSWWWHIPFILNQDHISQTLHQSSRSNQDPSDRTPTLLATWKHLCIVEPENVIEDIEASLCCWNQVEHLQQNQNIKSSYFKNLHNFSHSKCSIPHASSRSNFPCCHKPSQKQEMDKWPEHSKHQSGGSKP